jgi:UDP-N-acetylglucosamine acyltransferase
MAIHPTALVDPTAELASNVEVGPYCVIGPRVTLGAGCALHPHVHLVRNTKLGANNILHTGAVLGDDPQDRKFNDEETWLLVGDNNDIREYSTLHRGTGEGGQTIIGNDNLLMAYFHIGHNGVMGDRCTVANSVGISGHCIIEDDVTIGGMAGLHQYVRVGRRAMIGGFSRVTQDVPPYTLVNGIPLEAEGLNTVGMRRSGMSPQHRTLLKRAYKLVYRSGLNLSQALEQIEAEIELIPEVQEFVDFLGKIESGFAGRALDPRGASRRR